MKGQRVGYIRVSTIDQNQIRQLDGLELDKVFKEFASGKNTDRPELENMLSYIREGDTVVVHSLDRLARNLDDLRGLVKKMNAKGVKVEFLKENMSFTGEDSPMANLMLSVIGAFAEFERSVIRERQMEGIALAKKRGVYSKGRKKCLKPSQLEELKKQIANGKPKARIAREMKISRETIYKYLKESSVAMHI